MRWVRAAVLLAAAAVLLAGCQARFATTVELDRKGRGFVELSLAVDRAAQGALGLGETPAPETVAERVEPLLVEGGWTGGDAGPIAARLDDRTGEIVLTTRHEVDSIRQLDAIMRQDRPVAGLAPDAATRAALPGLPAAVPLL